MDTPPLDALINKRSRVVVALVETNGGISRRFSRQVRALERRSNGKNARDRTKYGTTRLSTKSYRVHHTQRISVAAVTEHAKGMLRQIDFEKQEQVGQAAAQAAQASGSGA